MKLSNSFTIDRPVAEVYDAFLDVARIATCMPGSRLIGEKEPGVYEGEVKVKVGPLGVAYSGSFTVLEADEQNRLLTMRAKGREQRGAGNADAHIVAALQQNGSGTTVVQIDTDLNIRGKVAQFGRGVISEVTDGIMQNFAGNVERMLTSGEQPTAPMAPTNGARRPAAGPFGAQDDVAASASASQAAEPAEVGDLDAWRLVIKPMLARHASELVTVGMSALAAYVGARLGTRPARRALRAAVRPIQD